MLQSDVRQDYLQVFVADLDRLDRSALDAGFDQLETRARDALSRDGFADADAAIEREVDLRYDGQQWPVRVALNGTGFDAGAARQAFEAEHQRLFGHIQPGGRIDITALRVVGRGRLDWTPPAVRASQAAPPKPREQRKVWIDPAHGWREVPIYDGADLRPGCTLDGPLLIEERTTTAFVGPRDRLEVDGRDDFLVHVDALGTKPLSS
jgi:N-methylhydantoinase A